VKRRPCPGGRECRCQSPPLCQFCETPCEPWEDACCNEQRQAREIARLKRVLKARNRTIRNLKSWIVARRRR